MRHRRSDFDVTNTVQVSSPEAVCDAVQTLFRDTWLNPPLGALRTAFEDFERLYTGRYPGYQACDTIYHDMQHALDVTLAMSRLLAGHDRLAGTDNALGHTRALVGVICALFHDAGYIRRTGDMQRRNGAEYTGCHIARGAYFLERYLRSVGLGDYIAGATAIVHCTGNEIPAHERNFEDPELALLGRMLGTADLVAQMADRCYLEKCRDCLFPELVLGGIAALRNDDGQISMVYESGIDLLRKTPQFFEQEIRNKLDREFGRVYRYFQVLYDGSNPYIDQVNANLQFLRRIIDDDGWPRLRRRPAQEAWRSDRIRQAQRLAEEHLETLSD